MQMNILKNYSFKKEDILTLSLMIVAFSIPFGEPYIKKSLYVSFALWIVLFGFKNIIELLKTNKFIQVYTLLILFYFISLLWSENVYEGWRYIRQILVYGYIPILIIVTSIDKRTVPLLIASFIIAMFINEIISYLIYFDLYQTAYSKIYKYPVGFINHIPYSVLVAFTAILILFQSKNIENKYIKILYILFFITMTTNLVISGGRTGYVAYFGTLLIMSFTYYKVNLKNFFTVLVFPIVIFAIAYQLNSDVQKRIEASLSDVGQINQDEDYNSSFGNRLASFPISYYILQNNNIFIGAGVGDLVAEKDSAIKENNLESTMSVALRHNHLHNFYADTVVNIGIIGLLLLFALFYTLWMIKSKNKEHVFMQQLIVIVMFISCWADRMLHTKETIVFFALFASVIIIQNKEKLNILQTKRIFKKD